MRWILAAEKSSCSGPLRQWGLVILLGMIIAACSSDNQPYRSAAEQHPASRIITLAPHLTELVYSAGAGDRLVGVVEYSDYPPAALELPRIGDAFRLDHEAIAGLAPDLILAWESGTPREVIGRLEQLGYPVRVVKARNLDGVADSLRLIGRLAGTEQQGEASAVVFESALDELRATAVGHASVRVFYQVSAQPLFTVSRRHVIGEAIELCGGVNIFGELAGPSPSVSPEAVIDAEPDVIITADFTGDELLAQKQLAAWRQWPSIPAVRENNLFFVDADLMSRSSVRILEGVRELCGRIEGVRESGSQGVFEG